MFTLATSVRVRGRDILPSGEKKCPDATAGDDDIFDRDGWGNGIVSVRPTGYSKRGRYGPFYCVLPPSSSQESVYTNMMEPLIDSFLEKKNNCTVFAYGQTGSGKTHTLFGPPKFFRLPKSDWGLCPTTMSELLERLGDSNRNKWDLRCSATEVYFDDCYDLLNKKLRVAIAGFGKNKKRAAKGYTAAITQRDTNGKWIAPFQQGNNGAFNLINTTEEEYATQGTMERPIVSIDDFLEVMQIVESTRSSTSHALNDRSSRSHCVVTIILTRKFERTQQTQTQRLLFVDLAGSERIVKTGVLGTAAAEAANINTSLSALGRCIEALRKNRTKNYIPWRDSALTKLMKQSLSGNCHTALVVTINESSEMIGETISTLRFGSTCGMLKNRVFSPEKIKTSERAAFLEKQLANLDKQLEDMQRKGMHGQLNEEEAKPTRDGFVDNYKKLIGFRQRIATAQKKGESESSKYMKELRFAENNIKDIVIRQMMTPVWREPKPLYCSKMKERESVLAELSRLGHYEKDFSGFPFRSREASCGTQDFLKEMSWQLTMSELH